MTVIAEDRLRTLRQRFSGTLIEPGQPGWDAATRAFNLAFVQEPSSRFPPTSRTSSPS